jgi:hypothetical protein
VVARIPVIMGDGFRDFFDFGSHAPSCVAEIGDV